MTMVIVANLILGGCATFVGVSGVGKWPRLFCWLGGLSFGIATTALMRM